ncbi:MAG: heavy metal-associated domain-containing protein [Thermodesulfobacteriota bacterium]
MATVKINGMKCDHCVGAVTKALNDVEGISNVNVDLDKGEASYDEAATIPLEKIKEVISGIGFEVE